MKTKISILLLFLTTFVFAQGIITPVDQLKIKTPVSGTAQTQLITRDATTGLTGTILKTDIKDVLEYVNLAGFPVTGAVGKIYVDTTANKPYRWSGSSYEPLTADVSDGDKGDITVGSSGSIWHINNGVVGINKLSTTGIPDNTKYLRGDYVWETPVSQTITNGVTATSPSEDAVYDAIAALVSGGVTDPNALHKTGNETITSGTKTFTTSTTALDITDSSAVDAVKITTTNSGGRALFIDSQGVGASSVFIQGPTSGTGIGLSVSNRGTSTNSTSIRSDITGTGGGFLSTATTSSNNLLFEGRNGSVTTVFKVDKAGLVTANSFAKSGSNANEILSGSGAVITAGAGIGISGGVISTTGGATGTVGRIPKFTSTSVLGDSLLSDSGAFMSYTSGTGGFYNVKFGDIGSLNAFQLDRNGSSAFNVFLGNQSISQTNQLRSANTFGLSLETAGYMSFSTGASYTERARIDKTTGNFMIGTSTDVASTIFKVASTTKASVPFPNMTASERLAISSPEEGAHVHQTDGTVGDYVYQSSAWSLVGGSTLGFTPEDSANKTSVILGSEFDASKYPSNYGTVSWVENDMPTHLPAKTSLINTDVILMGDTVGGYGTKKITWSDVKTVLNSVYQTALGYTAENTANKSTSTSLGTSNSLYPTQGAVKGYVDTGLATKQNTIAYTTANDANVLHTSGNETATGTKTVGGIVVTGKTNSDILLGAGGTDTFANMAVNAIPYIKYVNGTDYTLIATTALQKLFGATNHPTNGATNVVSGKKYRFIGTVSVNLLGASANSVSFGFLGTATGTASMVSAGAKAASLPSTSSGMNRDSFAIGSSSQITPTNSLGTSTALFSGTLDVTGTGTLIPSISTSGGTASTVLAPTYFEIYEINSTNNYNGFN